ncbi:hypothetical protein [Streptomyces sp. KL2]|uniref:hypothetical protein n=1 Tax=Streptomyces sp. KL2 TaxID=3050126 RepID=UPI00397CE039
MRSGRADRILAGLRGGRRAYASRSPVRALPGRAAATAIGSGVPPAVASGALWCSVLSGAVGLHGPLLPRAARGAGRVPGITVART